MVMLGGPWRLTLAFVVGHLLLLMLALAPPQPVQASALNDEAIPDDVSNLLQREPSYVLGMLTKLRSSFLKKPLENTKRGIDFGLGRGYSGNQAAKHFMGLVASQYAGGPGRKRKRSDSHQHQAWLSTYEQDAARPSQWQHQQQMDY